MARRYKHLEQFYNIYIEPLMNFCGLYIADDGFLYDNINRMPYESANDGRKFIYFKNFEIYKRFALNKNDFIPLNFINNRQHITLLMKFFRNAVFQRDIEFEDFFYEPDEFGNLIEIQRSIELITEHAEKHIELVRTARDYNNNVRYRWCIKTNIRNQIINKPLTESILPDNYPVNISILLSMLNCIEYYRYGDRALFLTEQASIQQVNDVIAISELISKELKLYKNKFNKSIEQEMYEKTDYLFNIEMNETDLKTGKQAINTGVLPMDIGSSFDL